MSNVRAIEPIDPEAESKPLIERVRKLEQDATNKQREITLDDLPLSDLKTKLEQTWQPEASVLLLPGSITENLLASDVVSPSGRIVQSLSGVSSSTVSGLDGNTAQIYKITACLDIAGTAVPQVLLRPNGDSTATYRWIWSGFTSGQAGVGGGSGSVETGLRMFSTQSGWITTAPSRLTGGFVLGAKTGGPRGLTGVGGSGGSGTGVSQFSIESSWPDTTSNITSLDIVSLGVGGTMTGVVIIEWS